MNKVAAYVEALTDHERFAIMDGFAELQEKGSIGDAPVRQHAKKLQGILGDPSHIVMWMQELDHECCRHYADRYRAHFEAPPKPTLRDASIGESISVEVKG